MCLKWLCKILCNPSDQPIIPEPKYLEDIDVSEIITIIQAQYPKIPLYARDRNYKTTTTDELKRFLRYDRIDENSYIPDIYDCDDFSFALVGSINQHWGCLSLGAMWIKHSHKKPHALNFFIDKERKIWIVEPQSDKVYELEEEWHPYLIII